MGLALPGQVREAIAAGHAVLITTSTGQSLLPANLVADTWQRRFTHDPTAVITATGAFGDFFTPARKLPTVTEQTRAQLRGRGCTVHTADGAALEVPPEGHPPTPGRGSHRDRRPRGLVLVTGAAVELRRSVWAWPPPGCATRRPATDRWAADGEARNGHGPTPLNPPQNGSSRTRV